MRHYRRLAAKRSRSCDGGDLPRERHAEQSKTCSAGKLLRPLRNAAGCLDTLGRACYTIVDRIIASVGQETARCSERSPPAIAMRKAAQLRRRILLIYLFLLGLNVAAWALAAGAVPLLPHGA